MTYQEKEQQMDESAQECPDTHGPEIIEKIYRLTET
jgi:hypothetical protein